MELDFISTVFYCEIVSFIFLAIISINRDVNVSQIRKRKKDADILSIWDSCKPSKEEILEEMGKLKKASNLCWVISSAFLMLGIIFILFDMETKTIPTPGVAIIGFLLSFLGFALRYFYKELRQLIN